MTDVNRPSDDIFAEFAIRYFDGVASADEVERLTQMLQHDERRREEFVWLSYQSASLLHLGQSAAETNEPPQIESAPHESAAPAKESANTRGILRWTLALATAACVLVAVGVWWFRPEPPAPPIVGNDPRPSPNVDESPPPSNEGNPSRAERDDTGDPFSGPDLASNAGNPPRVATAGADDPFGGPGAEVPPGADELIGEFPATGGADPFGESPAAGGADPFGGSDLPSDTGKAPIKLAVQANSDFAFDLYEQLVQENGDENLFFSPYSISTALAMTAEGARGITAEEMGKVLRFPTAARRVGGDAQQIPWQTSMIHTGLAELNHKLSGGDDPETATVRARIAEAKKGLESVKKQVEALRENRNWRAVGMAMQKQRELAIEVDRLSAQVDQYELTVANALWGEQTYPFKQDYIEKISGYYDTGGVFPVDFRGNFPAAKKRIDAWAAENTHDRIKQIVPEMSPQEASLMRLILTNAIYFKGHWSVSFQEEQTEDRDFTLSAGDKKQVPIMFAPGLEVGRYGAFHADGSPFHTPVRISEGQTTGCYPGADGFAMIELPYQGDDLSMVVLAPNKPDGLPAIEKKLTPDNLNTWIGQLKKRQTHVYLPKFKLETEYEMRDTLTALGMPSAFTDPQMPNGADFTGMSDSPSLMDRLYISLVVHKAFVEVNEKGTEAAAVTAVMTPGTGEADTGPIDIPFTPEFKADRPFLFLIREKSTGSVLFLGRMMNP